MLARQDATDTGLGGIKRPILLAIAASLAFLLAVILASVYATYLQQVEMSLHKVVEDTPRRLQEDARDYTSLMEGVLTSLSRNSEMKSRFLAQDREGLLHASLPYFEFLRDRFEITHFYFIDPDRVVFLRVHKPTWFGAPPLERASLLQAQSSGTTASGLEIGSRGTLTLRAVLPWHHEGKLIGYLELGKDVNRFFTGAHQQSNTSFFTFIHKTLLDREKWSQSMTATGLTPEWERFPGVVFAGSTAPDFPPGMDEYIRSNAWKKSPQESITSGWDEETEDLHYFAIPILDIQGREAGRLVGAHNHYDQRLFMEQHILVVSITALLTTLLLFAFLSRVLGRVEKTGERHLNEIRRLHENNTMILQSVEEGIVGLAQDGTITFANSAALTLVGWPPGQEVQGRPIWELFRPKSGAGAEAFARLAALSGLKNGPASTPSSLHEEILIRHNGSRFPAEFALTPLRHPDGLAGMALVFRDISQRRQAEEQLRAAKETAEEASRAKGAFLANMSHEIRSPMNAVIGMTSLVLNTPLTSEQRQYLEIVQQSSDALLALLNSILDFSKIEAGRMVLEKIPFQPREVVEDVCRTLAVAASRKRLELYHRLPPDMPVQMVGDPLRLRQILLNLIQNAVKFTHAGEIFVAVEQESRQESSRLFHFTVTDTGIGIPAEKQGAIFDNFTQVDDSTTRRYGGTGLGLAISRQLVELMGGRIWVESAPGKGSRFHFTIPFETLPTTRSETKGILSGLTVLVADAGETHRTLLKEILLSHGAGVKESASGNETLALLREARTQGQAVDVVLFDCRIPDHPGFSLARIIKSDPDCCCETIALLPPNHRQSDPEDFKRLGTFATLLKPLKQRNVLEAILSAAGKPLPDEALPSEEESAAPALHLSILLAEDIPESRQLATKILSDAGHTVTAVEDGLEALNLLKQTGFDLLLMDMHMPNMDGLTLARSIRSDTRGELPAKLPMAAITADVTEETRAACRELGLSHILNKPYRPHQLLALVSELVASPEGSRFIHARRAQEVIGKDMTLLSPTEAASASHEEFPARSRAALELVRQGIQEEDAVKVEQGGRELRTIAASVGAGRLRAMVMKLLLASRNNAQEECATLLPLLEEELREIAAALPPTGDA